MTLEELQRLAEAARNAMDHLTNPPMAWTDSDFCQESWSGQWTEYIKAVNPRSILKLLEMIAVLREGVGFCVACRGVEYDFRDAELALQRADEIERSL